MNNSGNQNVTGTSSPDKVQAVASKAEEAVKKVYKSTGTPDQEQVQAVASKVKEAVKKVYKSTANQMHIIDIFTTLCLVEQTHTRRKPRKKENNMKSDKEMELDKKTYEKMQPETREGNPIKCKIESYEGIFKFQTHKEGIPIKRIVVSGSAGIGKTTLIDKIAYDWALGTCQTLNKFELVFVLKMRSIKQASNLTEAIGHQLVAKDSLDASALEEFIDKNQDKVLILLDGFDEFKIASLDTSSFGSILKVLSKTQYTECWVVITSRPPLDKLVNKSLVKKPYAHVRVKGFSNTNIKEYVNKFFTEDHDKARRLIEQIELSDTLSDLAESPMLLLLMCSLWAEKNTLPDTMTRLYKSAFQYIFKRKERNIKENEISEVLIRVGKVALDCLISKDRSFDFREGDFEKSALDEAMKAGVLTSERIIDGLDTYQSVSFIHHLFLEYCAALYWQSLINTEEYDRILDQVAGKLTDYSCCSRYEKLLQFCCGENVACTNRILQKIHHINPQLVLVYYFESRSKELPLENVIRSILTDGIDISKWNNDSTNAFFHFLKQVAALCRGNDYFSEVKTLNVSNFNLHRFVEVLATSIKLMTNLERLSLKYSSLTVANTDQILSSLASPSTLIELDLSGNETLGGSVSLLAPQLMKLKCSNLCLTSCKLVAQDVSPIAKSMKDTLVVLDVNESRALGGCASTWGPELGKMECLYFISLIDCCLEGTDIEHIAMALSGVSTLYYLHLGKNQGLGGCAEMWALHLKGMRHLKEVHLGKCSLRDKDVEPIAVALSDIQTLVHLNLSWNQDLGGCAEMWALHLKGMRHLKEANLSLCKLRHKDVEPIAVALRHIQTLDISYNSTLGGCASLWALYLKKMNQLKELSLKGCSLTGGDMEPIAESVSDMPNLVHLSLSDNNPLIGCASSWAPHLKLMTKHLKRLRMGHFTDEEEQHINASIGLHSPILELE
ncbi:NLR family CARD domain-containing protein 4-like [Asterias amurensis]|uniref:NLR family CARD domain-containing protein 4-like n=1 Tax=Asterias amurensis TaxID=7602 RepID=UPI003AB562CC